MTTAAESKIAKKYENYSFNFIAYESGGIRRFQELIKITQNLKSI